MSHDVVFYGYDSLRLRATVAAAQLREFLQDLCLAGDATVNGTLEPDLHRSGFLPERIVLVAHSLGAVVCRRAMLDARSDGQDWAHKVSLGFFAPAHMGAHVLGLVGGVLGLSKLPLAPIAKWRFPILSELEEGSGFLKDLRGETEKAVEKGGADFLRARALAICEYDDVVNCQPFSSYDASPTVLSRDHLQICKPDADYLAPLRVVAKLIQG